MGNYPRMLLIQIWVGELLYYHLNPIEQCSAVPKTEWNPSKTSKTWMTNEDGESLINSYRFRGLYGVPTNSHHSGILRGWAPAWGNSTEVIWSSSSVLHGSNLQGFSLLIWLPNSLDPIQTPMRIREVLQPVSDSWFNRIQAWYRKTFESLRNNPKQSKT